MTQPNPEIIAMASRMREKMKHAEPLPWVWEQCGEKEDCPVVGVAFDENDNALSGMLPDYGDEISRWNIASEWGSGIDSSAPSANADFVVEAVNALPALLEIAAAYSTIQPQLEKMREALTACRDKFAEYVDLHEAKLHDGTPSAEYVSIQRKVDRNQTMVELCDDALLPLEQREDCQ